MLRPTRKASAADGAHEPLALRRWNSGSPSGFGGGDAWPAAPARPSGPVPARSHTAPSGRHGGSLGGDDELPAMLAVRRASTTAAPATVPEVEPSATPCAPARSRSSG